MTYKYFNSIEDPLIVGLTDQLMLMLDSAREVSQVPYIITSGLRTRDRNATLKGSVSDSAHLSGQAVDLACNDNEMLCRMVDGLVHAGFVRIIIYVIADPDEKNKFVPRHIHVDCDSTKPQPILDVMLEQNC